MRKVNSLIDCCRYLLQASAHDPTDKLVLRVSHHLLDGQPKKSVVL